MGKIGGIGLGTTNPVVAIMEGKDVKVLPNKHGLHFIEREVLKALAHHHVVPIPTAGRMFDPMFHEVVAAEETTEKPPGTILDQVRRGWMIGDRVLRSAGVRVATAPANRDAP